jgi:hypothetical protein
LAVGGGMSRPAPKKCGKKTRELFPLCFFPLIPGVFFHPFWGQGVMLSISSQQLLHRLVKKSFKTRRMQHRTSKGPGPANRPNKASGRVASPGLGPLRSAVLSHPSQGLPWWQSVQSGLLVLLLSLLSPYCASQWEEEPREEGGATEKKEAILHLPDSSPLCFCKRFLLFFFFGWDIGILPPSRQPLVLS